MSTQADIDKAHEPKDVDLSAAQRGVWLVKVPKYLSLQWKNCSSGTDVGKLKISKSKIPNKKPDIIFTSYDVSESKPVITSTVGPTTTSIPTSSGASSTILQAKPPMIPLKPMSATSTPVKRNRNHKFLVTSVGNQNLVVMSQDKSTDGNGKEFLNDKVSIEGKVLQRAECNPIEDAHYRQLKKEQVQAKNTPVRQIKLLPTVVNSYKPISHHVNDMEDRKQKKNETKRIRAEKDKVMDILFNAFEKHQFYNVKDLVGITKQPLPYLKEILKEICNYNMAAPHKNMWELKPEFRHYKQQEEG